jgi:hypothetical protein
LFAMKFLTLKFVVALMLSLAAVLVMAAFAVSGRRVSLAQTALTPTPAVPPKVGSGSDWILLDNVPPGSPQIEYGREIYRLACSACHGYEGQGLTTEWRMTWAPADQDCWQSKCHGLNHPPDGFFLPYSPPVTNLIRNGRFPTAFELQGYIRHYMPWEDPASLLDERAWQVTAYVLKLNNIDAGSVLNAETALKIRLVPDSEVPNPKAGAASSGEDSAQDIVKFPTGRADPGERSTSSSGEDSAQDKVEFQSNAAPLLIVAAFAVFLLFVGGVFWWRKAKR